MLVSKPATIWHGSDTERTDLLNAIARNCDCTYGLMGVRVATCAPHTALVEDQQFLDHVLYVRHIRECLLREEFKG